MSSELSKRGFQKFENNPSLPELDSISKRKQVRVGSEKKGFVIDGVGEVVGDGVAAFYEFEEVDNDRFIKLYTSGMRETSGLSKAGATMFGFICLQIQDKPNIDQVALSYELASRAGLDISDRVYRNGLRDLLEHEFIYESLVPGLFFVNVKFIFNGDRLALIKGYQRKKPTKRIE